MAHAFGVNLLRLEQESDGWVPHIITANIHTTWWKLECKLQGYMSVSALGSTSLPSMPDTLPGAGAPSSGSRDFADLISMTSAVASTSGVGISVMGEASTQMSVAESDVPTGETSDESPNFYGLAYLFLLQGGPNQVALEAASDRRYSLRPDLLESPEGSRGGSAAAGGDELLPNMSLVEQAGALMQGGPPELNGSEVQQLATGQFPVQDLLAPHDHAPELQPDGGAEAVIPPMKNLALDEKETGMHRPLNADEADQVKPEFQVLPPPPEASPEPSAQRSAGLEAFQVRVSKSTEDSPALRGGSRESLLQSAGASPTPIHAENITRPVGSDDSAPFTEAVSATTWVEPDVQQLTPLRQVSVAIDTADGPVHLRVHDRAGEMRAWVSTSTEQIAHTLQKGLGELTQSLNAVGFEAEVSWPRTASAALAPDVQSETSQSDGNSQQSAHQDSPDRGNDKRESRRERGSSEGEDFSSFLR